MGHSTQKALFNPKTAFSDARDDLLKPVGENTTNGEYVDAKLNALGRIVWIKKRETEPPEKAIPTGDRLLKWYRNLSQEARQPHIEKGKAFYKKVADIEFLEYGANMAVDSEKAEGENALIGLWVLGLHNPDFLTKYLFAVVHEAWVALGEGDRGKHPFSMLVKAWQKDERARTVETVSTTQTRGVVRLPYRTSEIIRREWQPFDGDVQATIVDGEPLAARLTDVTLPTKGKKPRLYVSKGQGQLSLAVKTERNPEPKPVPLVAFEQFSDNLRSPIATDVAILMTVAHASNQDIRLTSADGARFLARGRDGKVRSRVRETDKQRFEDAFGALHGMSEWVLCEDGIYRLFPLIKTDRINDEVVEFGPPTWAKNKNGRYTLSGAFGKASAARLIGQANDSGLWRTIYGVEYWLARGPATWSKKKERLVGLAQALLPVSGKTGPGGWEKITWRKLLILSGEHWDRNNETEEAKARQRYKRRIERLQGYGTVVENGKRVKKKVHLSYFTPSLGSKPAQAGDTVELHRDKRGHINVRATARFVEANKGEFETMRLADFMGI